MNRPTLRSLALATALAATITGIGLVPEPAPASASVERPPFSLTAFPHKGETVRFWDGWGARRPGGRRHKGIDIISPRGTEIVAAADGVVTALGENRTSGFHIRIDHGNGWVTSYLHLNNDTAGTDDGKGGSSTAFVPSLKVGNTVRNGQVIGYVGDSGNAEHTVPHTHFAMSLDGKKVNPYPFLKDVREREHKLPGNNGVPW